MRILLAAVLTLLVAACSTVGVNSPSATGALDPVHDDVASLLIAFDLPRGLGPNSAAGQLFTFDVANGGPSEHLRATLVQADFDAVANHLPAPAEGRQYYLYQLSEPSKGQIRAAQAAAAARGITAASIQLGIVPHLCSAGPVDQNALTVSIFATLPGRTGLLPFMNQEPLATVLQQPGSTQLATCS
jgi:hypothetical protein